MAIHGQQNNDTTEQCAMLTHIKPSTCMWIEKVGSGAGRGSCALVRFEGRFTVLASDTTACCAPCRAARHTASSILGKTGKRDMLHLISLSLTCYPEKHQGKFNVSTESVNPRAALTHVCDKSLVVGPPGGAALPVASLSTVVAKAGDLSTMQAVQNGTATQGLEADTKRLPTRNITRGWARVSPGRVGSSRVTCTACCVHVELRQ